MKTKTLTYFLPFAFCLLLISSCSPSQRLTRLLQRNPELLSTLKQDSFQVDPFVLIDTVVQYLPFTETDQWLEYDVAPLIADCPEPVQAKVKQHIKQAVQNKPCLQEPINFYDTLHYHDSDIDIRIPIRVMVSQEPNANAFNIYVQGWGGKVLSHSKAFQTTGITQQQIKHYRQQGMKILAGWLGGALLLLLVLYIIYRVYSGSFGAGAEWAKNLLSKK